ncbi:MAG: MFS transporter [Sulfurovaceae bacterium]|nr:MFS transporter [Sulfurovaceae bacterium]
MLKRVFPLSLIIGLRFFGLFVVLPVLSIYALQMNGATPLLAGAVMGTYALTQIIFQVPFGTMSDRIGRKKTLLFGLIIFIIGSVVCALSTDIYTLILGRSLQGAGSIGAVVTAMISDLVNEEERSHAMAIMGGTIAISFSTAMIIAPIVGGTWGIHNLFWLTTILSIGAIIILFTLVPEPPKISHSYDNVAVKTKDVFQDKALVQMYITFLFHSSIMTMAFFMIPIVMTHGANHGGFGWAKKELWKVYLPAVVFGLLSMGPAAVFGEKHGKGKLIFMISIVAIMIGFAAMGFSQNPWVFIVGVTLFFIGFNMFEPLLQSFVSKYAKIHQKGAALGVANTFAYVGIFLGGIFGGWMMQSFDRATLAIVVIILCIAWFIWIVKMQNPSARANVYLSLNEYDRIKIMDLNNHEAVFEVYINETENKGVVKYEKDLINEDEIKGLLG